MASGTYYVTVTDANGCAAKATASISSNNGPTLSLVSSINPRCSNSGDGSIIVQANGGIPPYSYTWNTSPIQSGPTATGLNGGTYIVTISDAGNCLQSMSVLLSDPNLIVVSVSISNASCGQANGSASATVSGGIPPYTYLWNSTPPQTTANATGLYAGVYNLTVLDSANCQTVRNVFIVNNVSPNASIINKVPSCGGPTGKATAIASGGAPPYSFQWGTTPAQNSATATGLYPGMYYVVVTGADNCTQIINVKIDSIAAPEAVLVSVGNANCNQDNGTATISAILGTAPYSFQWNTLPMQTGQVASDLAYGSYLAIVTDNIGCTDTISASIGYDTAVTQINAIPTCYGDTMKLDAYSSTFPTQYFWDFGDTVTGTNNTDNSQFSKHVFSSPGFYDVTLIVSGGCFPDTVRQTVQVDALPEPEFTTVYPQLFANSQSEFVYTGTPSNTFAWDFGDNGFSSDKNPKHFFKKEAIFTVTLTVTDQNGCSNTVQNDVEVMTAPTAFLPSAFRPGTDGPNGKFTVKSVGLLNVDFAIYTRLGNMVYRTTNVEEAIQEGWDGMQDGEIQPQGVYVYILKVKYFTGKTIENTGSVLLMR